MEKQSDGMLVEGSGASEQDAVFLDRGAAIIRIGLGIVYLWFGALKLVPGLSPAEGLAGKTLGAITFHLLPQAPLVAALGVAECAIGIALLLGFRMRLVLTIFFIHMAGTFLPLVLFPGDTFNTLPYGLSLVGQYIIKNVVFIGGGLVLLHRARGNERGR